ncbi:hypothetical protein Tco_1085311 [Tanacetum coccineum]
MQYLTIRMSYNLSGSGAGGYLKLQLVETAASTINCTCGSTRVKGWSAFRNILEEDNEASKLFVLPIRRQDTTFDLPPPSSDESSNFGVSKVSGLIQKGSSLILGNNHRGHYLRISDGATSPLPCLT